MLLRSFRHYFSSMNDPRQFEGSWAHSLQRWAHMVSFWWSFIIPDHRTCCCFDRGKEKYCWIEFVTVFGWKTETSLLIAVENQKTENVWALPKVKSIRRSSEPFLQNNHHPWAISVTTSEIKPIEIRSVTNLMDEINTRSSEINFVEKIGPTKTSKTICTVG